MHHVYQSLDTQPTEECGDGHMQHGDILSMQNDNRYHFCLVFLAIRGISVQTWFIRRLFICNLVQGSLNNVTTEGFSCVFMHVVEVGQLNLQKNKYIFLSLAAPVQS